MKYNIHACMYIFMYIIFMCVSMSWAVFYYSGAASAAGTNYRGALVVTPDGRCVLCMFYTYYICIIYLYMYDYHLISSHFNLSLFHPYTLLYTLLYSLVGRG